jgi:hypothetical protein
MNTMDVIHELASGILCMSIPVITFPIFRVAPVLDWMLIWSVAPYIILLVTLRYRAAYHRKLYKWQSFPRSAESIMEIWTYLRERFRSEAKTTPSSGPFFTGLWAAFCYFVFWVLYPRPFALCQYFIGVVFLGIEIFMFGDSWDYFRNASNLVYQGKRYRTIQLGLYYSKLQDAEQNTLYYPTSDLHGLIPLETMNPPAIK